MMRTSYGTVLSLVMVLCANTWSAEWKPAPGPLMTQWAEKVDPANPLPEYPRPQMVRKEWQSLNGLWDYAITRKEAPQPEAFDGQILVPFPLESALSGVRKPLSQRERLWYRRHFTLPAAWKGQRILLNFGAADWEAAVWVNGKEVGSHTGGYDGFSFDITPALQDSDNTLVVSVFDPTDAGPQPLGKQRRGTMKNPGGIYYTPCSGIWQSVWLEPVPLTHIESLKIIPDIDKGEATVTVAATNTDAVTATVLEDGKPLMTVNGKAGTPLVLRLPNPKLWSPESPFLYELKLAAGPDTVGSYFGMRKVAVGKDAQGITRLLLNNRTVFMAGPLDQGFWPDGLYTAPTDEALKYDVEATRKLGFNCTRKHVKVEPERWYYWCDKLGLLVWQDMPSGNAGTGNGNRDRGVEPDKARDPAAAAQFEKELKALIDGRGNHPAIIMWVVFNEGWGQFDTARLTGLVRQWDPSRLVNNASGWTDRRCGDVIDVHAYPGPGAPANEPARAAVLGEFGGVGLPVAGHQWVEKAWGYQNMMKDTTELNNRYAELWQRTQGLKAKGLSAAIYTQLTDVETESNGLMTYDRKVIKVDPDKAAAATRLPEEKP